MRSAKACGWIERLDRTRPKCRTRESELDCRQWEITEVQSLEVTQSVVCILKVILLATWRIGEKRGGNEVRKSSQ